MNRAIQIVGVIALLWSTYHTLMFPFVLAGLCVALIVWGYVVYVPTAEQLREQIDEALDDDSTPSLYGPYTQPGWDDDIELPHRRPVWPNAVGGVE